MRVWIATPSLTGTVTCEFAHSLAQTLMLLNTPEVGIRAEWHSLAHSNLLHFARHRMAVEFMASSATDLVFVDDDIQWNAAELAELLLNHDREVIGGICPRSDGTVNYAPAERIENGLIECRWIGTGIMRIKREAFERIGQPYFAAPYAGGTEMVGEDAWFCHRIRESGGAVWAMPMTVSHRGYSISKEQQWPAQICK